MSYFMRRLSFCRTAPSAWRLWQGHRATKDLASVASPVPSLWAAWHSVVTSTTSSALSPCTTTATRTAACSVPPVRPSTESRQETSLQARWSTMSFLTRFQDTPTAKPSGSFITSLLASRYHDVSKMIVNYKPQEVFLIKLCDELLFLVV